MKDFKIRQSKNDSLQNILMIKIKEDSALIKSIGNKINDIQKGIKPKVPLQIE